MTVLFACVVGGGLLLRTEYEFDLLNHRERSAEVDNKLTGLRFGVAGFGILQEFVRYELTGDFNKSR